MEPDGPLPIWRPRLKAEERRARVMIHEGVKAAMAANRIVREREPHPWLDEMKLYEHWGAIGGALAPQRLDFNALRRKKPAEVVYVCDNDFIGKSALTKVSEAYKEPLKGIKFDDRFPEAWDVADEMPQRFWRADGRYVGPTLRDMIRPATWAITWRPPRSKKQRPKMEVSLAFQQEWANCTTPTCFIHRDFPEQILDEKAFNKRMASYTYNPERRLSTMMDEHEANKVDELCYEPALPPGFYSNGRKMLFNTHIGGGVEPDKSVSCQPFLDFTIHLFPIERERVEVLRWVATLIARPGFKIPYALLMISERQGVGKSTLAEAVLAPIIGRHNYFAPSEKMITSEFNHWCCEKRLVACHEVYAGHSFAAYNGLKSLITDQYVNCHKKHLAPYMIKNHVHLILCSNFLLALKIDTDDRRLLVPTVTESDRFDWLGFYRFLDNGGLGAITAWADGFLKSHGEITPDAKAPWTRMKTEIVKNSYSSDQTAAREIISRAKERYGDDLVLLDTQIISAVRSLVRSGNRDGSPPIRPLGVRKVAKNEGLFVRGDTVYNNKWAFCTHHSRLISATEAKIKGYPEEVKDKIKDVSDLATIVTMLESEQVI